MSKAFAVIGAGYGDEGKGLVTDALVRRHQVNLVSRFNGGAQAGHTVLAPSGSKHVFGHFGAGTLAGAETYFSSKFIVNPLAMARESKGLGELPEYLERRPICWMHPRAQVTTIYDMMINAMIERQRGNDRHGSCGLGINETVTRSKRFLKITAERVRDGIGPVLSDALANIRYQWVPKRMTELGIKRYDPIFKELLERKDFDQLARDLRQALSLVYTTVPEMHNENVVLEGAQGLMLDEYLGDFPYVTRSITGLPYAIVAASELRVEQIEPIYILRAYATRHGAGPMKQLEPVPPISDHFEVVDKTNVPNEFQGAIRYAPLDLACIKRYIKADLARSACVGQTLDVEILPPRLIVTCLDQVGTWVNHYWYNRVKKESTDSLPEAYARALGLNLMGASYGPAASDIIWH